MDSTTCLVEYQLYDGGLQSHVVDHPTRPSWLPPGEAIGLRQTEGGLRPGEYAVEFARLDSHGNAFTWIGCFTHAPDRALGDRGNHGGVGVWLLDAFPANPIRLLGSLRELCDQLAASGKTRSFEQKIELFRAERREDISPCKGLPPILAGVPYSPGLYPGTACFTMSAGEGATQALRQVGWAILAASIASGMQGGPSRQVFFLQEGRTHRLEAIPAEEASIAVIIDSLGTASRLLQLPHSDASRLLHELSDLRRKLRETQARSSDLEAQLHGLQDLVHALESERAALKEQLRAYEGGTQDHPTAGTVPVSEERHPEDLGHSRHARGVFPVVGAGLLLLLVGALLMLWPPLEIFLTQSEHRSSEPFEGRREPLSQQDPPGKPLNQRPESLLKTPLPKTTDPALAAVLASSRRPRDAVSVDRFLHPAETLTFFGLKPDQSVIELWPGSGYWTEILSPYLKDRGHYAVALPADTASKLELASWQARFSDKPQAYGHIEQRRLDHGHLDAGSQEPVDLVLTFGHLHRWVKGGYAAQVLDASFRILKPGGILGIEENRIQVDEGSAIKLASQAGFILIGISGDGEGLAADNAEHFLIKLRKPVARDVTIAIAPEQAAWEQASARAGRQ
jgi:predicted methyltransferase